jgi:hypothetical protein
MFQICHLYDTINIVMINNIERAKELKENAENTFNTIQEGVYELLKDVKNIDSFINNENNLQKIEIIKNKIINLYE